MRQVQTASVLVECAVNMQSSLQALKWGRGIRPRNGLTSSRIQLLTHVAISAVQSQQC